jgi:spore maturation protein CgeB
VGRIMRRVVKLYYDPIQDAELGQHSQIKGRNFEVPGCGGFLLTNPADNLTDYYDVGREVVCFESQHDMIDKIRYYLTHEDERNEIAKTGYQRTMRDHTYEKRFREIFSRIGIG